MPSHRAGSLISRRAPSARQHIFFPGSHAQAWAIRATIEWWTTSPVSAQRTAARESWRADRPLGSCPDRHTMRTLALAAAHMQIVDATRKVVRQAPDHVTPLLAPAASTPPILTNDAASQHCMV